MNPKKRINLSVYSTEEYLPPSDSVSMLHSQMSELGSLLDSWEVVEKHPRSPLSVFEYRCKLLSLLHKFLDARGLNTIDSNVKGWVPFHFAPGVRHLLCFVDVNEEVEAFPNAISWACISFIGMGKGFRQGVIIDHLYDAFMYKHRRLSEVPDSDLSPVELSHPFRFLREGDWDGWMSYYGSHSLSQADFVYSASACVGHSEGLVSSGLFEIEFANDGNDS